MGGARSKNSIFTFLGYPSTILRTAYMKQFYPKPVVYRSKAETLKVCLLLALRVCDQAFGKYRPLKGAESGHVTISKIENLHIVTRRKIH